MTNGTTNPLLTNTQSTIAAGFLSLLSTIGSPVLAVGGNDSRPDEQSDSGAADSEQQPTANTAQATTAPKQNALLSAQFSDTTATNFATLATSHFGAAPSAIRAAVPSMTAAHRPQRESAGSDSAVKHANSGDTPVVLVAPVPANVSAIPASEIATSLTASVQTGSGVAPTTASDVSGVTPLQDGSSVAGGQNAVPANQASFGNAANALPFTPGSLESGSNPSSIPVTSIPVASTPPTGSLITNSGSSRVLRNDQLSAVSNEPAQIEDEQPALERQAGEKSAANDTTALASTATPNAAHKADQQGFTSVFAHGTVHASKAESPAAGGTAGKSADQQRSTTAEVGAGSTDQSLQSNSTPNSTVSPSLTGGLFIPAVPFLPGLNFPTTAGSPVEAIGKSGVKTIGDAGSGKDSGATDLSTTTKGDAAQSAATNVSSAPGGQNNAAGQHAPADPSQILAVATKTPDGMPLQTAPAHVAGPAQPANGTTTAADKPHTAEVVGSMLPATTDGSETAGTSAVNTAKLIQTLSETQMHVGMRSAEFGDISIRTAVSQQQMVAQITVDHGDLGRAIAEHVPAARAKLGDDLGVRAAIQVTQNGMSFSHDHSSASQQQPRSFTRPVEAVGAVTSGETETVTSRAAYTADDSHRLDIRA